MTEKMEFKITDEISFWYRGKSMHGNVVELRGNKILVEAWPCGSPTTVREYLIDDLKLKKRSVKNHRECTEVEKEIGHNRYSVRFSIMIGNVVRRYRILAFCNGKTSSDVKNTLSGVKVELPYVNSTGIKTKLITTFGRVAEMALTWEVSMKKRKEELKEISLTVYETI